MDSLPDLDGNYVKQTILRALAVMSNMIACIFGYNLNGKTKKITLPVSSRNIRIMNIMGNQKPLSGKEEITIPLSEEPVYLVGEGVNTEQFLSLFQKAKIEVLDK